MTSAGGSARIDASAASFDPAKVTATPTPAALDLIFDRNMRSSTRARTIADMLMDVRAVGPFYKNGFVLGCEDTRDAVLIDPGDEVGELLAAAESQSLVVRHILLTHAHVDHITGVAAAKRVLKAPVYLHHDDLFLYERVVEMGAMFGLKVTPAPPVDVFYTPGQIIRFGTYEAIPHHTPGHCPGG